MVKRRGFLVGGSRSVFWVDKDSTLAIDVVGLDSGQVVMGGEFIVVDDVLEHIATDLEGGHSGWARVVGEAMPAQGMACIRAATEAEAVADVVLVALMVRAAAKMVAIDKANHPFVRH